MKNLQEWFNRDLNMTRCDFEFQQESANHNMNIGIIRHVRLPSCKMFPLQKTMYHINDPMQAFPISHLPL